MEFELIDYKQTWGEDRVYFYNSEEMLVRVPVYWTDIVPQEPFVEISAGRSFFRTEDLLGLWQLLDNLKKV
jgi:hypothetical protein